MRYPRMVTYPAVMLLVIAAAGCKPDKGHAAAAVTAPAAPARMIHPAVTVRLTPRALAELERRGETITVAASWYGDPLPAALGRVDESGRLAPGRREWRLPARGGQVDVVPDAATRDAFADIAGPVGVNVNVYSSRLSGPDNLLSCDFIDGDMAVVAATPRTLSCGLIEDSPATRAYP